jgi:hypothetical protein
LNDGFERWNELNFRLNEPNLTAIMNEIQTAAATFKSTIRIQKEEMTR